MSAKEKYYVGTVLRDHPAVEKQAQQYATIAAEKFTAKYNYYEGLPSEFDGFEVWKDLIQYTNKQFDGADWAFVAKEILLIRQNINTYGVFFIPAMSQYEMLLMIDKPPLPYDPNVPSTHFDTTEPLTIYQGYSIYDAFEYCFLYGFPVMSQFSLESLQENDIDLLQIKTFEDKMKVVKDNPELLNRLHGLNNYRGVYEGRLTFRCTGLCNLGEGTDASLKDDIFLIKTEIYRFGPVISGMLAYDDFVQSYDGTTIYTGPGPNNRPVGGHAIGILGWGTDPVEGEYWICGHSFGVNWGLTGVFRIKTGLKECMIERNCVVVMPGISNSPIFTPQFNFKVANPKLYKKQQEIDELLGALDYQTFYRTKTEELIRKRKLTGRFGNYEIVKLIPNPSKLIKFGNFFASNVNLYYYIQQSQRPPVLFSAFSLNDPRMLLVVVAGVFLLTFLLVRMYRQSFTCPLLPSVSGRQ